LVAKPEAKLPFWIPMVWKSFLSPKLIRISSRNTTKLWT
jgi:hypothetical protein